MNIEIANRLQKLRKEKGLSQEELAFELGISRQAISKWECGESSPDTDNLISLSKLYGISIDEILFGESSIKDIKKEEDNKEDDVELDKDQSNENSDCEDDLEDEHVHISTKGIDVKSKEGERVHVGWDGIHVHDNKKDQHVDIDLNGIKINNHYNHKLNTIKKVFVGVTAFITLITYILLGFYFNKWHVAWVLFFLIPIVDSIFEVIIKKSFSSFAYPILVTAIYLFIGMEYQIWHPTWWVFITIPVYYIIFNPIDHFFKRNINIDFKKDHDDSVVVNIDDNK